MQSAGATLRLVSNGGMKADGAFARRHRAAAARAVAALASLLTVPFLVACETTAHGTSSAAIRAAAMRHYDSSVDAGLGLYDGGEFPMAARRFNDAVAQAAVVRSPELEKRAVTAECLSWMRARKLGELSDCSQRLESLQRRARRSEPGTNTLIAFGAIAGNRPLPSLRIPNTVRPLVWASAQENR